MEAAVLSGWIGKICIWLEYPEGFPDRLVATLVKRGRWKRLRGSGLEQGLALRCLVEIQIEMS